MAPAHTAKNATNKTSDHANYSSLSSGSGLIYCAAGDVTYDGTNTYLYDAEGRICAVRTTAGITGYVYDAAGIRVARLGLGALSCNFAPGGVAWDVHARRALGPGGEQVTEFNGAGTWQHSNVYAGKLLGTYDTKGLHFYLDDWLGTRRIQTNALGQLEETCQSLPYGNGQQSSSQPCIPTALSTADDPTEQFFTGKERDPESGDDYFEARYYNSAAGRFLSPDWSAKEEPVPYAKIDDPQTLNLYDYVRNNPMTGVDADGHWPSLGEAVQFVGGVVQGVTSSVVALGTAGGPKESDSNASLNGQMLGSALTAAEGVLGLIDSAAKGAALGAFAPETGGATLLAAGAVATEAAASIGAVAGGSKNLVAVASAMASRAGGGRNAQKANTDRVQSAKDKIADLKGERDKLASKANKTPEDKEELKKMDGQIKQQQDRMKASENHSQKGKGQQ